MNHSLSSDSNVSVATEHLNACNNKNVDGSRSPSPASSVSSNPANKLSAMPSSSPSSTTNQHTNNTGKHSGLTKGLKSNHSSTSSPSVVHSPATMLLPPPPPPPPTNLPQSSTVCNAKQLGKLKRFLTTLQQFAADISPDISDRVRHLILDLINSVISVEEFHSRLQETTHFPLRPFVIPFLKINLPLLQRELVYFARIAKQSIGECFVLHPDIGLNRNNFDPKSLTANINQYLNITPSMPLAPSPLHSNHDYQVLSNNNNNERPHVTNDTGNKRKSSPDYHTTIRDIMPPSSKRSAMSPTSRMQHPMLNMTPVLNQTSQVSTQQHSSLVQQMHSATSSLSNGFAFNPSQIKLDDISLWRELREKERLFTNYVKEFEQDYREVFDRSLDEDYKSVDTMLNCILDMVGKTKRAMALLQTKTIQFHRQSDSYEGEIKRKQADLITTTIKHAEDRVNDIKKRADEAVNDIRKQASNELQKAVMAAEYKANEIIKRERDHFDMVMHETHKKVKEELANKSIIQQCDNLDENCWNCGRKALETCTGCNKAKYCSQFCQHKHWEHNHYRMCANSREDNNHIPSISDTEQDLVENNNQQMTNTSSNEIILMSSAYNNTDLEKRGEQVLNNPYNFNNPYSVTTTTGHSKEQEQSYKLSSSSSATSTTKSVGHFGDRSIKKYSANNSSANSSCSSSASSAASSSSTSILPKILQAKSNENITV